ncbi:MAG: LytTR family transcriptional regulator [Bacteroidetes bacterium HGW-Bacteroidetes-8]|nr:MAG: LytTR family transcriptional regulator [Bacteroidetes bacterium HGW-Bacteroidetes-8]
MNIPDHINNKRNIVRLIGFTALFALVFINIYKPFSSSLWYNISEFMFFVYSSLVILTGLLVVLISRIVMYLYSRRHQISYGKYAIWVFLEILFMSLFYTMYTIILNRERDVMDSFESSFINTALVLLLPYIVLWFYFGWRESTKRLEKIESEEQEEVDIPGNITFNDEKGVLRLSVLCNDLLYIESSENYVVINYSNKGKVKRYLLRNTLKNIEGALERSRIIRCHRSYLVNLERAKVIRRDKEGLFIELDTEGVIDIPVSKSYQKKVSEIFLAHSFKIRN